MNNVRLLKRTWYSTIQGGVLWARLCHHTWSALGLPPRPHFRSVPGLLAIFNKLHTYASWFLHLPFLHLHPAQFTSVNPLLKSHLHGKAFPNHYQNSSPCPCLSSNPDFFFITLVIWRKRAYLFVYMFVMCFPCLEHSSLLFLMTSPAGRTLSGIE